MTKHDAKSGNHAKTGSHAKTHSRTATHSKTGKVTVDHDQIKHWVEARGGHPARVKGTGSGSDGGLLRIDFPDYSGGQSLEEISWEEFFDKFEEKSLAFLYQDETSGGEESRFSKLVHRDEGAS